MTRSRGVRMTAARLATLKHLVATDAEAKGLSAKVMARAQSLLAAAPVSYGHNGVEHSLLTVSREVCDRLYSLGLAYLLSGKKEHAARAVKEMTTVAGFPDWNPTHFLDTAEMTHCVGIGYDWTFQAIGVADRATIEQGVAKNGLQAYLSRAYPKNKWDRAYWNWNQVVNGGVAAGALAFADALPELSAAALGNASKGIQSAFRSYAPSGAWTEGLGYWGYGTNYGEQVLQPRPSLLICLAWAALHGPDGCFFRVMTTMTMCSSHLLKFRPRIHRLHAHGDW